jgi:hypothetical protein
VSQETQSSALPLFPSATDDRALSDFMVTGEELRALARYWYTEFIDFDYDFFVTGDSGSYSWYCLIIERLRLIRKLIGEDKYTEEAEQAEREFCARVGPEKWRCSWEKMLRSRRYNFA